MRVCPAKIRWIVIFLVLLHLMGVLAEPLRFFSRSTIRDTAPDFGILRRVLSPYVEWMYLDHGYFFFAPNPGPGHLVECRLTPADVAAGSVGQLSEPQQWVFPDRNDQWPRLLYHRYFMLSEFYNDRFAWAEIPKELAEDPDFVIRWRFDRGSYESIQTSIARSISDHRNGARVELKRIERSLPESEQVLREGWRLNDPRLLQTLPESIIETAPPAEAAPADEVREPEKIIPQPRTEP